VRAYVSDVLALAQRAGMPALKIYLMDAPQPNAFATGRDPNHAAVAATHIHKCLPCNFRYLDILARSSSSKPLA